MYIAVYTKKVLICPTSALHVSTFSLIALLTKPPLQRFRTCFLTQHYGQQQKTPEVFYEENNNIVGISVAIGDSSMSILQAGAILGQCEGAYESSEFDKGKVTWFSIHDDKGGVIETTYDPHA